MNHPYKLVAFDVDGTLIDSIDGKVVWQLLNHRFGNDEHVNAERFQAYLRKEITYADWVDMDIGQWVKAGAKREQMAEVIMQHLQLVLGVQDALAELKQRGMHLAVISGTLDLTLELLLPEHPFEDVFTNKIWFDEEGMIAGWRATPYDMEGKAHALVEIAQNKNIPLSQTVYVGDNINDLQVMSLAGLSVAFKPKHPSVASTAHFVLQDDMRKLLHLL